MNPDPYRDLTAAYNHLTTHPPAWTRTDTLDSGVTDDLVKAIRTDAPDSTRSDETLRTLISIGRTNPTAITVVLYALADDLRHRIARSVTSDYRADALGDLATVILDSDLTPPRLAKRLVNRAHNRTNKQHRRVRHHGHSVPRTVDPYSADTIADIRDQRAHSGDVADLAAARVDLERFHAAVTTAVTSGELSAAVWTTYRGHRLRSVFNPPAGPVETRERVAAYRAAKRIQPFIDLHLRGHAA